MIDWIKERATENYCGWCIGITCLCNGSCWKDDKNCQHHLNKELEKAQQRIKDIEEELNKTN